MNKILIIANPKAGKGKINKYLSKIETNLKQLNFIVNTKYTTIENNATNIIKQCKEEYDILIICGGDGTLNEAIQGLTETNKKVYIGFIPMGTTNDYARTLKVSFNKLDISKNINNYISKEIDLGIINENIFNYVVSFGVFSKSSYQTSGTLKNKFGRVAYVFSGIKEIFDIKTYNIKIKSNENEIEDNFIYGSVSNSEYVGGFNVFKNKTIELDDGKFEALFLRKPKNLYETIKLLRKVLSGNLNDPNIYCFKTDKIQIESLEEIEWSIDGEYGGKRNQVNISNLQKHNKYITPSNGVNKDDLTLLLRKGSKNLMNI